MSKRVLVAGLPPGGIVKERIRQALDKRRVTIALCFQEGDDFGLVPGLGFFGGDFLEELRKIYLRHVGNLVGVNVKHEFGPIGNVYEGLTDGPGIWRRLEVVFTLRNIFRDLNRILAHRPERSCHFLTAVIRHFRFLPGYSNGLM